MTKDTWAIIGTMYAIGDFNSPLADLRSEMNARLTDLDGDIDHLRTDVRGMGERLRDVEINLAGVDRRLATLERAIIPDGDGDE